MRWRFTLLPRPNGTVYGDYTDFLIFAADVALLTTLFAWGLSLWLHRKPVRFGPAYVWIPLLGLTLVGLFSSITSVDKSLSLYHTVRLGALFLFYLFIVNESVSILWIGVAVGLQGALQSVVAIAQSLLQRSIGLNFLGEYTLDPTWTGVSIVSDGAQRFLRAYGLSDHPNILGGCLAFALLILLAVYLRSERETPFVMIAIPFALISVALFLTFSRGAWLAFLTGAGLIAGVEARTYHRQNIKPMLWLAVGTSFAMLPFIWANRDYVSARFNAGQSFENIPAENQSVMERAYLNEAANQIFVNHALIGIGLGASPVAMKIAYPEFPANYQPPHFALLAAALETGIFGATFYFLLLTLPWVVLLRRKKLWTNPNVIGAAGLLLAITMVGFFDYYTWLLVPGRLWQWLGWGMFAAAMERSG